MTEEIIDFLGTAMAWIVAFCIGAMIPLAVLWSLDTWGVDRVRYTLDYWLATAILLTAAWMILRSE